MHVGGFYPNKKLPVRLVAGVWCLSCFVIVTAYSSVLISFIVSPNLKPIVSSIQDVFNVPGLKIVAPKGSSWERVMSVCIYLFTFSFKFE
jgi:hypothetical protein